MITTKKYIIENTLIKNNSVILLQEDNNSFTKVGENVHIVNDVEIKGISYENKCFELFFFNNYAILYALDKDNTLVFNFTQNKINKNKLIDIINDITEEFNIDFDFISQFNNANEQWKNRLMKAFYNARNKAK